MKREVRLKLRTGSEGETEAVGRALGALAPPGTVVALRGELASGKTCLVRGMAARFAPGAPVHSPTFTLVNQYGTEHTLYHLDLYRLSSPGEVADLGYEELFDSSGVCAVEWAERAEPLLPAARVDITLAHAGGDLRDLEIRDSGVLPEGWADALRAALDACRERA